MANVNVGPTMTVAYVGLSLIGVLIFSLVIYRLVRTFLRAMSSTGAVFGDDLRTRMISFGVAALLSPRVVPEAIRVFFGLFVGVYSDVPRWLLANYQRAMQSCQPASATNDCIGQLWFGFASAWGSGLDYLYGDKLRSFPFSDAIFMLTSWALLAQLLAASSSDSSEGGRPRLWLQSAYTRLSTTARQNLRFFVVLATAGYLSIAAIAALPGLLETPSTSAEVSVERLQDQLKINPQPPEFASVEKANPFQVLEEFLRQSSQQQPSNVAAAPGQSSGSPAAPDRTAAAQVGSVPAVTTAPQVTNELGANASSLNQASLQQLVASRRQSVESTVSEMKRQRQEIVSALKTLMDGALEQARTARSTATTTYEASNIQRKGSREQVQHFLAIATWFQEGIADIDRGMRTCSGSIGDMDRAWSAWAASAQRDLQATPTDFRVSPSLLFDSESYARYRRALEACRPELAMGQIPPRPALGGNLGPFSIVASWLLKTESLPLALVVGLFGFGLLGSACSTFVREQAKKSSTGVLVYDLPGVVIRGLSAAIVVFLAVEGGLAIFATGTAQPNPYVLLLTCLIGSVFSEDVWDWAHEQLRERLSGGADSAAKGSKQQTSSRAAEGP